MFGPIMESQGSAALAPAEPITVGPLVLYVDQRQVAKHEIHRAVWGEPVAGFKDRSVEILRGADVVVTMGCGDACPVIRGPRYLDWHIDDPVGRDLAEVRRIRLDISNHVLDLIKELIP